MVLALSWGVGPSLLATLLGAGVVIYYLRAPPFATLPNQAGLSDAAEWALTLLLVIVGVCVAFLISRAQRFRRRAESLSSELRATLRAMTEAVLVFDSAGYMRQANVAAQRILGLDAGDKATSRSLSEYLLALSPTDTHGQPVALEQLPTSRVLRGEVLTAADMIDLRVHLPDGREVELEATGEPMLNAQAQRLGGVCVFRDVTERRQLERRTHATLDALLAMAETLVLAPKERDTALIEAEAPTLHAERITAQRLADLMLAALGCQRVGMFAFEPESGALRPLAAAGVRSAAELERWTTPPTEIRLQQPPYPDIRARLRRGEVVILDRELAAIGDSRFDEAGAVLVAPMLVREELLGTLYMDYGGTDHEYTPEEMTFAGAVGQLGALVIERERLVREREEARASELAVREGNRRMDDFLNIASHELKTPLTSLTGNLQLVARRLNEPGLEEKGAEDLVKALRVARSTAGRFTVSLDRMGRLVNDLLETSRIHAGGLTLRLTTCDLAAIVSRAVEEHRVLASKRSVRLVLHVDADRIEQVIANYLANALKYSREDQPIEVRVQVEGDRARVSVRDEGIGVPVEDQEHIWERFHRVDGAPILSGSGIGLGLGLYISRNIIAQHHGEVGVQSAPGEGATFWFTLPLARPFSIHAPPEGEES